VLLLAFALDLLASVVEAVASGHHLSAVLLGLVVGAFRFNYLAWVVSTLGITGVLLRHHPLMMAVLTLLYRLGYSGAALTVLTYQLLAGASSLRSHSRVGIVEALLETGKVQINLGQFTLVVLKLLEMFVPLITGPHLRSRHLEFAQQQLVVLQTLLLLFNELVVAL